MSFLGHLPSKNSALIGIYGLEEHPVGQHICTCPPGSLMGGSLAWVPTMNQQPLTANQLQRGGLMVWIAWTHSLLQRRQVSCRPP